MTYASRYNRCDLLSKCIFDILINNVAINELDHARSCDLLSKCIFDI